MKTASSTVSFTTTVNIKKFNKDKLNYYKAEKIKLAHELRKVKRFRIFKIMALNRKMYFIDDKITECRNKLKRHY